MVHVYALIPREQCRQIGWWLGEMERAHGLPKASKKLIPLPRSCSLSDLSSSGYLPNTHPPYPHPPWFHPPCSGSIIEKYFLRAGRFRICRSLKTLVQAMIWTKISAGCSIFVSGQKIVAKTQIIFNISAQNVCNLSNLRSHFHEFLKFRLARATVETRKQGKCRPSAFLRWCMAPGVDAAVPPQCRQPHMFRSSAACVPSKRHLPSLDPHTCPRVQVDGWCDEYLRDVVGEHAEKGKPLGVFIDSPKLGLITVLAGTDNTGL